MPIPILAQLGMALLARKMQRDEENAARRHASQQQLGDTLAAIQARRAARAGDSGYMQAGIAGFSGAPLPRRQAGGQMLTQLGAALMSQSPEPETAEATGGGGGGGMFSKPVNWAGSDSDDEEKWGSYA